MEQGLENLLQGELHLPATLHLQPSILSWVTNEDEVSPLLQGPSSSDRGMYRQDSPASLATHSTGTEG